MGGHGWGEQEEEASSSLLPPPAKGGPCLSHLPTMDLLAIKLPPAIPMERPTFPGGRGTNPGDLPPTEVGTAGGLIPPFSTGRPGGNGSKAPTPPAPGRVLGVQGAGPSSHVAEGPSVDP